MIAVLYWLTWFATTFSITLVIGYFAGLSWVEAFHKYSESVTICSALHTLLPPWDWKSDFVDNAFNEFTGARDAFYKIFNNRYYRLLIYVIGYWALNGRSTVWAKAISIKTQLANAAQQAQKP